MYFIKKQSLYKIPVTGLFIFKSIDTPITADLVGSTFICDFIKYEVITVATDKITNEDLVLCKKIKE